MIDIIVTVQDGSKNVVLSPLGQKIVDTLDLSHLIENLSPKAGSATQHRLFVVPPQQREQVYNLISESGNGVSFAADDVKKGVKRIAFVHVGKQEDAGNSDSAKADKLPGLEFRQQYAYDDALIEKRDLVKKRITAAYEALYNDDTRDTRYVAADDVSGDFGAEVMEALELAAWRFRLEDQDSVDEWKRSQIKEKGGDVNDVPVHYKPQFALLTDKGENKGEAARIHAESQNFARDLSELPANMLTPTIFANKIESEFGSLNNDKVKVSVHDAEWARKMEMHSFLSVAQGSDEEPRFVEVEYRGRGDSNDTIDLFLVGKGVCFDTGGISLKPGDGMKEMKSDMGGAASVISALHGIVRLGLPINANVVVVLVENMPSGKATKPGDVVRARNKKSIEIDNTDAEGRLVLADALVYASEKSPKVLVDVATLTGACIIALGHQLTAAYTSTRNLWSLVEEAGVRSNDYFWRMPLYIEPYKAQLKSRVADLNNIGGRAAGSATAATFLSEFVDFDKVGEWAHLDIAGTAMPSSGAPTGRPTRALIHLADLLANKKQE